MFDNPKNVKRVIWGLLIASMALFAADFLVPRKVEFPWESIFGFYGIYGFVACVLLVVLAKGMRKIIMRKDDYYDR